MKNHSFFRWLTLVFFLLSHFPQDLLSAPLQQTEQQASLKNFDLQSRLAIPGELGRIQKSWKSSQSSSQPWVIHIQDLHVDYEAQKNIAAILKTLHFFLKTHDPQEIENGLIVAVEGAQGKIDPQFFSSFPNAEVRQDTADYFLRKAKFTGPEFFSILHPDWKAEIFGIEDKKLYLDHKEAYERCMQSQKKWLPWFESFHQTQQILEKKFLSKEAIRFLREKGKFEKGEMDLSFYARTLMKKARSLGASSENFTAIKTLLEFLEFEKALDSEQAERERNQAIQNLSSQLPKDELNILVRKSLEYRLGRIEDGDYFKYLQEVIGEERLKNYPQLERYIQLVEIKTKLKFDLIFGELQRLQEDLASLIFKTPEEKSFLEFSNLGQLIEKLVHLNINREELSKFKEQEKNFNTVFSRFGISLPDGFNDFESFYRIAQDRDQVLFHNTLTHMKESKRKVVVLFTGGFHTEALTKSFEKSNISYTVITPNAAGFSKTTEMLYQSRMLGNRNAFEEMLLAKIKSLHPGTLLGPLTGDPVLAQQLQQIHRVQFEITAGADALAKDVPQIGKILRERREQLKTLYPEISDLEFLAQDVNVDGVRYVLASKGHEVLALRFAPRDSSLGLDEDRFEVLEGGFIGPYKLQVVSASNLSRIFKIKHFKDHFESTFGKEALRFLNSYEVSYLSARRFLAKIPMYKEVQLHKTSISFGGATYFVGKRGKKVYFFRFVKGALEEAPFPERYSVEDAIQVGKVNVQVLTPRVFKNLLRRTFLEKDIRERFPKDFFDFVGMRPTRPVWTDFAGEPSEDLAAAVEVLRHYDVGRVIELAEIHGEVTEHGSAVYVEAEKGTYVLRPISSNIRSDSVNEARFEISLIQHLVQNGFPATDIIPSNEMGPSEHPLDKYFVMHSNGKVYLLYDYMEGSVLQGEDLTPEERSAMVNTLARLHQLTEKRDFVGIRRLRRINDFRKWKAQLSNLRRILKEKREKNKTYQYTKAEKFFLNRLPFILSQIAKFQKALPARRYDSLPRTVIHGRFRPQNMVFKKGPNGPLPEVIGVFDWVDAREEIRVWDFLNGLFKRSIRSGRQFDIRMLRWVIDEYQKYRSLTEIELDAIPEIIRAKILERISSLLLEFTRLPHRLRHDLSGIPDEQRALWLLDHEKSVFEMARRYVRLLEDIDRKNEDGSFEVLKAMTMKGATKNPYVNAVRQIMRVAPYVGLTEDQLWELARPKRVVALEFPVMMDDGSIEMFKGYRVHHNDDLGPTKGGIRYHPGVTREEVKALAAWMTIKNSIAGLPYGGGKGGVEIEPKKYSKTELARISRAYFRKLSELEAVGPNLDIPAPDVNTSGETMSWMVDEYVQNQLEKGHLGLSVEELEEFENISREEAEKDPLPTPYLDKYVELVNRKPEGERKAIDLGVLTGKPVEKGGSIGRTEATGQGVFYTVQLAVQKILKNESLDGVRVRVQGFGNVGSYTALFLHQAGAKITAVGDDTGSIENLDGIDIEKLLEYAKKNNGKIKGFPFANPISADQLLEGPCDILIPAALENQITEKNADKIHAAIVVEAANGPTTPEADKILEKRGIPVIPDVLANSGGVTVSYFEWLQNLNGERWTLDRVNRQLQGVMEMNFEEMYRVAVEKKVPYRLAAYIRGVGRVIEKMMVNQLRAPPTSGRKPTAFKTPGTERAPPEVLPDASMISVILSRLLGSLDEDGRVLSEIPITSASSLPSEHESRLGTGAPSELRIDLAYSVLDKDRNIVEIKVREDLWERIKDDSKAQAILIRHEFTENVVIPQLFGEGVLQKRDLASAHYFTSYVDYRMEGTPLHALMNHVIPLMSDEQLRAIQLDHPNDPRRVFYDAVQTELEARKLKERALSISVAQELPKGERDANLFIHKPLIDQDSTREALDSAVKQISDYISKNQHIRPNNRSALVKLLKPIERFVGDENPITHLQVKGVLFDARKPLKSHQGKGVVKTTIFNQEGYLRFQEYSGIPQGGAWLEEALSEFLNSSIFQNGTFGVESKYPIGWGEFPGLSFHGRRLGFVVLGMNRETNQERGIEVINFSSMKTYGQMLGRLHRAGFIHRFPHPENISIPKEGPPVLHDLGTLMKREEFNPVQDLGYLYWELRYGLLKLKQLLLDTSLTEEDKKNSLVNFLQGYFEDDHFKLDEFTITQFIGLSHYLDEYFSVTKIEDFNPIFKRLKETVAGKFSLKISPSLDAMQRVLGGRSLFGIGMGMSMVMQQSLAMTQVMELKQKIKQELKLEIVLQQERYAEFLRRLIGSVTERAEKREQGVPELGFTFTYYVAREKDYKDLKGDDRKEFENILTDMGGAFALFTPYPGSEFTQLFGIYEGTWILVVSGDVYPEEFVPVVAAHEYGHQVGITQKFATRLEFAAAKRLGKSKEYLRWLLRNRSDKIVDIFDQIDHEDVLSTRKDKHTIKRIRERTLKTDSAQRAIQMVKGFRWPKYIRDAVKKIKENNDEAVGRLSGQFIQTLEVIARLGPRTASWRLYLESLEDEAKEILEDIRDRIDVFSLGKNHLQLAWNEGRRELGQIVIDNWQGYKENHGELEALEALRRDGLQEPNLESFGIFRSGFEVVDNLRSIAAGNAEEGGVETRRTVSGIYIKKDTGSFKAPGTGLVRAQGPPDPAKINATRDRLKPAEFENIPFEVVDSLSPAHDNDFAHLADGKILIRRDLWERIRDDGRAQFILRRHEYVENVLVRRLINKGVLEENDLGQKHALTSAIDSIEEGTALHALMQHVIPLMSDEALQAIKEIHPNDPDKEFYNAVQGELAKRSTEVGLAPLVFAKKQTIFKARDLEERARQVEKTHPELARYLRGLAREMEFIRILDLKERDPNKDYDVYRAVDQNGTPLDFKWPVNRFEVQVLSQKDWARFIRDLISDPSWSRIAAFLAVFLPLTACGPLLIEIPTESVVDAARLSQEELYLKEVIQTFRTIHERMPESVEGVANPGRAPVWRFFQALQDGSRRVRVVNTPDFPSSQMGNATIQMGPDEIVLNYTKIQDLFRNRPVWLEIAAVHEAQHLDQTEILKQLVQLFDELFPADLLTWRETNRAAYWSHLETRMRTEPEFEKRMRRYTSLRIRAEAEARLAQFQHIDFIMQYYPPGVRALVEGSRAERDLGYSRDEEGHISSELVWMATLDLNGFKYDFPDPFLLVLERAIDLGWAPRIDVQRFRELNETERGTYFWDYPLQGLRPGELRELILQGRFLPDLLVPVTMPGAMKVPGTGSVQAQAPPDPVKIKAIQERLNPAEFESLPFEVVGTLGSEYENDFAHLADGKILIRRDLWERIRDDGRAQLILRRHEYVENVLVRRLINERVLEENNLGQKHALTSAIDAIEEGTPVHALMQYVIPLMSDEALKAIQPFHPNDPMQEFYAAVQKEIKTRFPEGASEVSEDFLFDPSFPEGAVYNYFKDDEFMKMAQGFESIVFSSDGRYVLKFPYRSKLANRVARVMKRAADWSWMFLTNHGLRRMWVFVKPGLQYFFHRWALEKNVKTAEGAQETVSHYELALKRLRGLIVPYRILSGKGFEVNTGWLDEGTIDLEGDVILQKGVAPSSFFDATLKTVAERGDVEEAKNILKKIVDFQTELWRRGVMDWDFGNFGGNFILDQDGAVKMLDIGGLSSGKEDARIYVRSRGDFARFIHERLASGRQPYQIIEEILPTIFLSDNREAWDLGRVLIRLSYIFRMNPKISHEVITEFFRLVSDQFTSENVEFHWGQSMEWAEQSGDTRRVEEQVRPEEIQDVEASRYAFLSVNEILTPDQLEEMADKVDESHPELARSLRGLAREVQSIKILARKKRSGEKKYEVYRAVDQEGRELDLRWPIIRLEILGLPTDGKGAFKTPGAGPFQAQAPPSSTKIKTILRHLRRVDPLEYKKTPFRDVESFPGRENDFAYLNKNSGEIVVLKTLWESIKGDPEAQSILQRHEYVENVLIPRLFNAGVLKKGDKKKAHALASAVDASLEKTAYHGLMKHVIPLMKDDQLRAIQSEHPNDPRYELYRAVQDELERRIFGRRDEESLDPKTLERFRDLAKEFQGAYIDIFQKVRYQRGKSTLSEKDVVIKDPLSGKDLNIEDVETLERLAGIGERKSSVIVGTYRPYRKRVTNLKGVDRMIPREAYSRILAEVEKLLMEKEAVVIRIGGRSGTGKTTIADALGRWGLGSILPSEISVLHADQLDSDFNYMMRKVEEEKAKGKKIIILEGTYSLKGRPNLFSSEAPQLAADLNVIVELFEDNRVQRLYQRAEKRDQEWVDMIASKILDRTDILYRADKELPSDLEEPVLAQVYKGDEAKGSKEKSMHYGMAKAILIRNLHIMRQNETRSMFNFARIENFIDRYTIDQERATADVIIRNDALSVDFGIFNEYAESLLRSMLERILSSVKQGHYDKATELLIGILRNYADHLVVLKVEDLILWSMRSREKLSEMDTSLLQEKIRQFWEDKENIALFFSLVEGETRPVSTKKAMGEEDLLPDEFAKLSEMTTARPSQILGREDLVRLKIAKVLVERQPPNEFLVEHQDIVNALLEGKETLLTQPIQLGEQLFDEAKVEIHVVDVGEDRGFRLPERSRPLYEWTQTVLIDGKAIIRVYVTQAFLETHSKNPSILAQALIHPLVENIAGRSHMEAVQHEAFYQEDVEERKEAHRGEGVFSDYSKWVLEEAAREGDWDYLLRMTEPYRVNFERNPSLTRPMNGRAYSISAAVTRKAWDLLFENESLISSILKGMRDKQALLLFVRSLWWWDDEQLLPWLNDLFQNEVVDDQMVGALLKNLRITPLEQEMILGIYQGKLIDSLRAEGIHIKVSDEILKKENHIRLLSSLKRFPDWLEEVNPQLALNRESTGSFKVRSWITSLRLDAVELNRRFLERVKYFVGFHFAHLAGYNAINYLTSLREVNRDFMTSLDHSIPLIPEAGWIYYLFYPVIVLPAFLVRKVKDFRSAFGAYFSALGILFTVFLVYPARMPRPEIDLNESFSSYLLHYWYKMDLPYNTTPSTHATLAFLTGLILFRTVTHASRFFYFLMGTLIGLSTVFVRQHFVVDVITGWAVAYLSFKLWFDWRDRFAGFLRRKFPRLGNRFHRFKVPEVEKYPPIFSVERADAEAFKDLSQLELTIDPSRKGGVALKKGKIYLYPDALEDGEKNLFDSLYHAVLTKVSRAPADSLPEIILEDSELDQRLASLEEKDLVPLNSSILDILGGEDRLKPWFDELGLNYSFADMKGFLNKWKIYFVVSPGMMGDRSAYRLGKVIMNNRGEDILNKGDLLLNYEQFDFLLTQAALSTEETERHGYYRAAFALLLHAVHGYLYPQNLPDPINDWESVDLEGAFNDKKLRLMSQYVEQADFDRAVWEVVSGKLKLEKEGKIIKFYDLRILMKNPNSYRKIAGRWLEEGIKNIFWNRLSGVNMLYGLNAFLQGPPRSFSSEFELKVFQDPLGVNQTILKRSVDSLSIEKFYPRDLALPKGHLFNDDDEGVYVESSA